LSFRATLAGSVPASGGLLHAGRNKSLMIEDFRKLFGSAQGVRVYRAPGRVNLIGEHTDYNLGFVCPVALQLATYAAAAPSPDGQLRVYSEDRREMREIDIAGLGRLKRSGHWTDYLIGVARELAVAGFAIPPVNLLIRSTVPEGSGLSSSAALEVSTALAFLAGRSLAPLELALLCQRAERDFVGMPCGIMDQYISVFGRRNAAVEIDCRSLEHRDVPLPAGATFVAVNSMVKHALAASAYKERVEECALALTFIARLFPDVRSLRDVSPDQFHTALERQLPPKAARRALHVIHENARVAQFCEAAARGDLDGMGRLMVESHRSLQYDYEVSCPELDFLVDRAMQIEGVIGSRMTGGGFGGCTVTMLRPEAVERFRREISYAYEERFGVTARIYECRPSDGAGECRTAEALPADS
jgi:galactokinase